MTWTADAPPFYRGDEISSWCDRLMPDGNACDEDPTYEVRWIPTPGDGDTDPVSAVCVAHGSDVDRNLIRYIRTLWEVEV